MKRLPEALQAQGEEIKREYELRDWKNIEIGLPDSDYSGYSEPHIFIYATSPSGERLCCIVVQGSSAFNTIKTLPGHQCELKEHRPGGGR
jgi:hypothetical protein